MAYHQRGKLQCKWLIERWDSPPLEDVIISWEKGTIHSVEHHSSPPPLMIIPGLVNAHVHPDFSHLFPAHHMIEWIKHVIAFRRKEKAHPVHIRERDMIKRGTVAWGSILAHPWEDGHPPPHGATRVAFHEVLGDLGAPLPPPHLPLSPHAPYSLSPQLLQTIWRERKTSIKAIHLAESLEEVAFIQGRPNAFEGEIFPLVKRKPMARPRARSPVEYLELLDCLDPRTLAVHATFIDEKDVEILARRGVSVVFCPRSNLYLSGAITPFPLLREAGIPVALGTDGLGSTPSLSLWEEMRTFWFYAKSRGWRVTPQEVLSMASHIGAKVLGLSALTALKKGKEASFIVLRLPQDIHPQRLAHFVLFQGDLHIEALYIKGKRVL